MPARVLHSAWLAGCGAWLVAFVGCGGGGPQRLPIHGSALPIKGEPFDGMITFVPDAGHSGPSASATLKSGKYEFTKQNGPVAGPHRVTVVKIIPKSQLLRDKDKPRGKKPPPGSAEEPPAEPKMEWPFVIKVPDSGDLQCDFDLE